MHRRTICDVLRELMDQEIDGHGRPITQTALSERTGVPQPTISRIRKGKHQDPERETVERLANYFGVTAAQMRGEEPLILDAKIRHVATVMESMKEYEKDTMVNVADSFARREGNEPPGGHGGSGDRRIPRITYPAKGK